VRFRCSGIIRKYR